MREGDEFKALTRWLDTRGKASSRAETQLLASSNSISYKPNQSGEWDVTREREQRKTYTTTEQLKIEAEEARHRRDQEAKDNEQRRNITYLVIGLIILGYIFSGVVATNSENADTRDQAWAVLNVLIGALAGAIAGYFAGAKSK